jgi:hypothetical protein
MASLTRTIRRHIKWTKPKSKCDGVDKGVYVKQKMDRADIVKEDKDA